MKYVNSHNANVELNFEIDDQRDGKILLLLLI